MTLVILKKIKKNKDNLQIYNEQRFILYIFLLCFIFVGGGTFDTAIVSISPVGVYHVRSTNGHTQLGGAKLVDILMRFCLQKLAQDTISKDDLLSLRSSCENAKIQLSTSNEATVIIGNDAIVIKCDEYEALIEPFIEKTMGCVNRAIEDACLEKKNIGHIVLVGGGTYTPLVRRKMMEFFGKVPHTSVDPMEAGKCSIITIPSNFST